MNNPVPGSRDRHRKTVLLVDDHPIVRMGLSMFINQKTDLVVSGEADDESSALAAVQRLQPDVAVVDWSLKDRDVSEMITTLRQRHPSLPILVLPTRQKPDATVLVISSVR
jgi:two-component system, NarL family, invasion response regulator UvrY